MVYIVISFSIYIVFVLFHVFLHRFLAKRNRVTFKTVLIFGLGFILDILIIFYVFVPLLQSFDTHTWWNMPLPYTAVLFYILLAGIHIIFYTAPAFSYISPSTMILRLLENQGKMTYQTMRKYFSDKKLIEERLMDIAVSGLIIINNNVCRVTEKGGWIVRILGYYKGMLGWSWGG